jgi:hypothetical protein
VPHAHRRRWRKRKRRERRIRKGGGAYNHACDIQLAWLCDKGWQKYKSTHNFVIVKKVILPCN